jgi:hypothetical protein
MVETKPLLLSLIVAGAIVDANGLWWTTGWRDGVEVVVVVPFKAERVDDVQPEGRGALNGVADHFGVATFFGSGVAGAEVLAVVVELGPDVVCLVVEGALVRKGVQLFAGDEGCWFCRDSHLVWKYKDEFFKDNFIQILITFFTFLLKTSLFSHKLKTSSMVSILLIKKPFNHYKNKAHALFT